MDDQTQNAPIIFEPSFRRAFIILAVVYGSGYPIGSAIAKLAFNSFEPDVWLVSSAAAVLVGVVLSLISSPRLCNTQTIVIDDGEVEGPSRKGWCTIPLDQVDIAASRQRGALLVILGQYRVRSVDGRSITIDGTAHSGKRFEEMLNTIHLMRSSAAPSQ